MKKSKAKSILLEMTKLMYYFNLNLILFNKKKLF